MDTGLDIAAIQTGNRQAFAALVTAYQAPLFGFLGRMGLDHARAEEIAQDTFLRAWANIHTYRPGRASLTTWLFTIARNLALNAQARSGVRRETAYGDALPELACDRPSALEALDGQQQRRRLRDALLALPDRDRAILALAYVRDISHADIARIESCSPGAVKVRIHRAKERLRALLENRDGR
jgi:RNA polymerase sigma-70 factor (ECF subfamily)